MLVLAILKESRYVLISILVGTLPYIIIKSLVAIKFEVSDPYAYVINSIFFGSIIIQIVLLLLGYKNNSHWIFLALGTLLALFNIFIIVSIASWGFW
ncbi:hypothetical protein J2R98_001863 [Alkalibacillus filiformis]|uniref:Uncharacterized protein n=1 Tax=Alkalibacillus filiformis TaxID=200990 RepID=A0ABU0DUL5_9BACI|nr:hypothetical protein [Alkalibacillus filiformis]